MLNKINKKDFCTRIVAILLIMIMVLSGNQLECFAYGSVSGNASGNVSGNEREENEICFETETYENENGDECNYCYLRKGSESDIVFNGAKIKTINVSDENIIKVIPYETETDNWNYLLTVTGLAKGTSTITVTTEQNNIHTCEVRVYQPKLDFNTVTLIPKESTVISYLSVNSDNIKSFKSDNEKVATVSEYSIDKLLIKGITVGTCNITITDKNNSIYNCKINVTGINTNKISIKKNSSYQLKILNGSIKECVSSNTKIATIDNSGKITATSKSGTCTMTVIDIRGKMYTCNVTVNAGTLNKTSISLYKKYTYQLKVSDNTIVSCKSSNTKIATVNNSGKVYATNKTGSCTITVTDKSGNTYTCKVTVKSPYLNSTKTSIYKKATYQLKITGASIKSCKSSNTKIATVNKYGKIYATNKAGSCTITVTDKNNNKYYCKVTVKSPYLNSKNVTTYKKNTYQLKLTGGTIKSCKSSNTKIATVNKYGKIYATNKTGSCTITVTDKNNNKYTCKVTVKKPYLNKTSLSLYKNATYQLKLTGATIKSCKRSNSVVSVTNKGLIKGLKTGSSIITVLDTNNSVYLCKVSVKTPTINTTSVNTYVNKTYQLKLSGSTMKSCKSNNTKIATVDSKGKIKAIKIGSCTITVKDNYGNTYTCKVNVKSPALNKTSVNIYRNNSYQLTLNGATIKSCKSSNTNIATVSSTGKVSVKNVKGSAKIYYGLKSNYALTNDGIRYGYTYSQDFDVFYANSVKWKTNRSLEVWDYGTSSDEQEFINVKDVKKLKDSGKLTEYIQPRSYFTTDYQYKEDKSWVYLHNEIGNCTITVTDTNNKTYTCKINVLAPYLTFSSYLGYKEICKNYLSSSAGKLINATSSDKAKVSVNLVGAKFKQLTKKSQLTGKTLTYTKSQNIKLCEGDGEYSLCYVTDTYGNKYYFYYLCDCWAY